MTFSTSDRTVHPAQERRGFRARSLLPLAVLVWTALEIWLLVLLAERIGAGWVLLILLAGVVGGAAVVKRAGRRAWNSLAGTLRAAAPRGAPGAEAPGAEGPGAAPAPAEGAGTAMLGGVLLMVPGLLTDVAALLCLFPPTRRLLAAAARRVGRRAAPAEWSTVGNAYQQARMRMPDGKVVPGEVVRDPRGEEGHSPSDPGEDGPRPPLTP